MEAQTEARPIHLTPGNVVNNRKELRPLPLRVAHAQYARLNAARERSGLSIQEHVRRAIDLYLAVVEKEAIELGLMDPETRPKPRALPTRPRPAPSRPVGSETRKR